ncbi:MAG: non-heme iron oxygenase ferredoxin subunit [Nitrososphaerota archaeon]|jgi:3-phenylpropionate/trans-cinnamate dioxygenase ferredoxin subunit|nr:non-heme iron oxygenase ferredoxin subunit [Nitrososphaerota archaeon]MDG6946373.1 non-heme iron oxygenase ferredoxin subunit [Nitrososphaerota archaeon]MDG6947861.1 non-heme iron oxygenase ferredoxin subunit [Nitrososphaerota archaeon]MDG7011912.1 non-heme iron oxygenase ferredoxin subunit [Nitrososphaerota archaeon]MDG7013513.1 non-heme iron oxygenase ferredoxin subunit [Nitrososphaerota archaeon]
MKAADLAEGSISAVDIDGEHVLLSKIGGEVFAVAGTCTHEEADLGQGFVLDGRVVCPLHLSQFDLKTGDVVTPPATDPLKHYKTRVDAGTVYVEV